MGLNPFVISSITNTPAGVPRAGFGVPALLSYQASVLGSERVKLYGGLSEVAADFPVTTGPEYLWAQQVFAQTSPTPERVAICRGTLAPTMVYTGSVYQLTPGDTYPIRVRGQGVTTTDIALALPLADLTYTAAEVSTGADTITITGHGLTTGALVRLTTGGTLLTATGVAADTNLWVIVVDDDTIQLATTRANALAGTEVDITNAGAGTTTVKLTSNDVLVARAVEAMNLVVGKNYTAAVVAGSGDTDTWTVTGNAAGSWFSIEVHQRKFALALTHADPGVATDLAAIAAATNGNVWYELHTAYNSTAYITAVAAWTESHEPRRTYLADVVNTLSWSSAGTDGHDVINVLHNLGYARTQCTAHNRPAEFASAAVAGTTLAHDPGKIARAHRSLVGVTPMDLTDQERTNLIGTAENPGKCGNGYFYVGGVGNYAPGRMAVGEWWDVIRNDDFVNAAIVADWFDMLRANKVIPYTDEGIATAEGVIRARLAEAVANGIYLAPRITKVRATAVSGTEKQRRRFRGLSWSAERQGAIVFLAASGSIS